MRILKDVKFVFDNNILVGKVVLKDDSSVSGIVLDVDNKNKYLVMGNYDNYMYNLVISSKRKRNKVYYTTLLNNGNKDKYLGELYETNGYKKFKLGIINALIIPSDYYRDVNEGEIISLLDRVNIMKYDTPNLAFKYTDKLYENNQVKIKK